MKSNVKYYYNSITIYMLCKIMKFNYKSVSGSIRYRIKKYGNKDYDIKDIIVDVVDVYSKLKIRKNLRDIISNKDQKINISKLTKKLKIPRGSIYKLKKLNFNTREAIIIAYFLNSITKEKINAIKNEIISKEYTMELKNLLCYFYLYRDNEIKSMIYNIIEKDFIKKAEKRSYIYGVKLTHFMKEDLKIDFFLFLNELLESNKIISNENYQIKWYIIKSSYRLMDTYFKEQLKNINMIHLEDEIKDDFKIIDTINTNELIY